MSRLIEADKALQAVDERIVELYKIGIFRKKADSIDVLGVKKWINDIPTIHAIPVDKVKTAREEIKGKAFTEEIFDEDIFNSTYTESVSKETAECESYVETEVVRLNDVLAILDKLIAESEETDTQKCHDCADYNQEKHYCPKYCDLIRNTMNDNINAVLEDVKDEVKNIATFDNLNLLVEVAKIIDSHKRGQE